MAIQVKTTQVIKEDILDEDGVWLGTITFNPTDRSVYKNFLSILQKMNDIPAVPPKPVVTKGEDGRETIAGVEELKAFFESSEAIFFSLCAELDAIFGAGICEIFHKGNYDPEAIYPLLEGIMPYFQKEKDKKVKKYARNVG